MFDHPHRRYNSLTGEWVSVSPHRSARPWQGSVEEASNTVRPQHDPQCYLCAGNSRADGKTNPVYTSTFAFTNDFPAFLPDRKELPHLEELLRAQPLAGTCRVLCFSPRHDLTLAQMSVEQIRAVVDLWASQVQELGKRWRWVQVFENKGELMGCSNPHPHGQVWASDFLPNEPAKELRQQTAYHKKHGAPLLVDYADLEIQQGERLVLQNEHWLAVVPWWAMWPFEALLLPRRRVLRMPDLSDVERYDLACLLKKLLGGYDALFDVSFPYSMGWHGAPNDDGDYSGWQLHAHVYPPLLRSAAVKKFMVGYEMLGEPQRDLTPECAAERLRSTIQARET
jgi:UDPglucose--hexose-1-phosphate uridylyltransferase